VRQAGTGPNVGRGTACCAPAVGVLAALWLAAAPALACYTGLTLIPTAETVGANRYGVELQFDGAFPARSTDTRIVNTQFGFGERLEAGVDYDLSEEAPTRVLLNAKCLLATGGERTPALAVGICDVGRHLKSTPYAVATQELRGLRGHLGIARIESSGRWFVGTDGAVSERVTLMADCTSGDENWWSLGANYQFDHSLGVLAGVQFPSNGDDDPMFTVHVVFSGPYREAR